MRELLHFVAVVAFVNAAPVPLPVSIDDSDASITYRPITSWVSHIRSNESTSLWQNTVSWTDAPGASASWTFSGTSIEYWGIADGAYDSCVVTVDGTSYSNVSGHAESPAYSKRLFALDGLDPHVEHTIAITAPAAADLHAKCVLDRFVYTPPAGPTYSVLLSGRSSSSCASTGNGRASSSSSSGGSSVSCDDAGNTGGLSQSDKIALGTSLGMGLPTLLAAAAGVYYKFYFKGKKP